MSILDKNPHFCTLPFFHLNIDYDGRIKPCCKIQESSKMRSADVQDAFHSDYFEKLRTSFLMGQKPEACRRCWKDESAGVLSYRQKYNLKYKQQLDQMAAAPKLKSLDTAFGNFCNAKCVTCESISSHMWTEEEEILNRTLESAPRLLRPRLDFVPEYTSETLRGLDVINLTQSEALVQKGFYGLIKAIKSQNIDCSQKTIKISTNGGAQPNTEVLEFIKSFGTVDIQFSIDATGEAFNYLRFPLKWNIVENHVQMWIDALEGHPDLHWRCRFTASALNLQQFFPVLEWWNQFSFSGRNYFNIGIVSTPEYLSPAVLPDEDFENWSRVMSSYLPHWMPHEDFSEEKKSFLRRELDRFLEVLEKHRGNSREVLFSNPQTPSALDIRFTVSRT